jgi:hypothetical protein
MATEMLNGLDATVEAIFPRVELAVIADPTTGNAAIQNNIPDVEMIG